MKVLAIVIVTVIVVIGVEIAVAYGVIASGWYNVAADAPDLAVVDWVVSNTRENSVGARVRQVQKAKLGLDQPAIIEQGAKLYASYCAECHLAPGMKPTGIHLGENPEPPELAEYKRAPEPREIYWIVNHGIKMTGMPAWGKTLSDRQIWALAAFLQKLPHLSAAKYQQMTEGASER